MRWTTKYILAVLPASFAASGWQTAVWAYAYFECTGNLKNLQPCYAGMINILPALGFGLFWCQLLTWVTVPISLGLLIEVGARHIGAYRGNQERT
jgi:hypothetical protein